MNSPEEVAPARLLADVDKLHSLDHGGMLAILERYPDSIRHANQLGREFDPEITNSIQSVVVAGLGGSAIGGEVVQSLVAGECRVPILVNREHSIPGFVGQDTMVIACSYSGNTEETFAAYGSARERTKKLVAITSGGELAAQAEHDGVPLLKIPGGNPPRTAIAYSVFPILWILHRTGVWQWNEKIAEETAFVVTAECNQYRPEVEPAGNAAKQIALGLQHTLPVIYAPSYPLAAVASRWKGQLCENAKTLAMHNVLPEMTHNEIEGWKHRGAVERAQVICLRDRDEHPRVSAAMKFLLQHLHSVPVAARECWGRGESLLARIFSLILLGDYASVYLAFLYREDPTPVAVIEKLKKTLRRVS
ncbi:MAG: bifunctional phosphoglucose/phosphomannose isomerase [Acidobacteria bacterium]|nr:bifunctional phosphoglucose/phosphomannose isomerase [Acidobacteriota bacterium]